MARLCSVEGCQKRSSAKGFCDQHYRRNLKYGSPTGGRPTMNGDLQRWLDKHVSYDGLECLIWPFAITEHSGYGKADYQGVSMNAHRVMCIMAHGEPERPDLFALHSCGKGHHGCVNPRHLRWGTAQENTDDRAIHGTMTQGEDHPQAVLTSEQVVQIRSLKGTATQREIAAMFGVSQSAIYRIHKGLLWRSVA